MPTINYNDCIGEKHGHLEVMEAYRENKKTWAICKCDLCGNTKAMLLNNVRRRSGACGCLEKKSLITHGLSHTRLYKIWQSMKTRCNHPSHRSYNEYGGRGIKVCDEWLNTFQIFYDWSIENGYADDLQIDRECNGKGYSPDNCRWVNLEEQARNKRIKKNNKSGYAGVSYDNKNNKWRATITYNGKSKSLGRFDNIEDAIAARKSAEQKYWYGSE